MHENYTFPLMPSFTGIYSRMDAVLEFERETPCHARTRYHPFFRDCGSIGSLPAQLFEFIAITGIPSRKNGCVSWTFLLAREITHEIGVIAIDGHM